MKRSNPMFVAWIVFLVFLILCRAALIWTGMLKASPCRALPSTRCKPNILWMSIIMRRKFQELMFNEEPITCWESTFRDMPQLVTPHLLLRAPRMGDAQDMYDYSRDVEVARYVLWDAHRSIYEARSHLRHLIRRNQRGGPGTFAVVERQSNRMIGTIGYTWMDADAARRSAIPTRAVWGRGTAGLA